MRDGSGPAAAGVLLTRPEPGLSETMRAVAALGLAPVAAPMSTIRVLSPGVPRRVQAVLLTSGQAAAPLAGLAPWLLGVPVLAVGEMTALRATEAGFGRVSSADGDAARLAGLAVESLSPGAGPVLVACGQGQGGVLAAALRASGFRVIRRCVYRAVPARRLGREAVLALEQRRIGAAMFFSAETAGCFVRVLPPGLSAALVGVRALAIGARAGERLSGLGWKSVEVAARPDAASMMALLGA